MRLNAGRAIHRGRKGGQFGTLTMSMILYIDYPCLSWMCLGVMSHKQSYSKVAQGNWEIYAPASVFNSLNLYFSVNGVCNSSTE